MKNVPVLAIIAIVAGGVSLLLPQTQSYLIPLFLIAYGVLRLTKQQ